MIEELQRSTVTATDRYPHIFKVCASFLPNAKTILSYGCADGSECVALAKYFPNSNIIGVDVSEKELEKAKSKTSNRIVFYQISKIDRVQCDIVFAMSVLCRLPLTATEKVAVYTLEEFSKHIEFLDSMVVPGGLLVLFNTQYRFQETKIANHYHPVLNDKLPEYNDYIWHRYGGAPVKPVVPVFPPAGATETEYIFQKEM